MTFFKKDIIDDFLSRLSIPGIKILANKELNEQSLRENGVSVCRGSILDSYLEEALDAAFGDNPNYEVVALFEGAGKSAPISFLIVEKGECEKLGNAWSVNLICAVLQSPNGLKGVGQILMGLYLYIIAENEEVEEKVGVLELANGYINAGGLASYSKLGFKIDKSLYGADCFPNYNNLPMIAEDIDPDRIVDILNNVSNAAYEKEALCLIGDRDIQLYAGIGLNLLTFMTLVPEDERKEYFLTNYGLNYGVNEFRNVNYKYLYNLIRGKEPGEFETLITDIERGRRTDTKKFPGFSNLHKKIFTKGEADTSNVTSQLEEPLDRKSRASRASIVARTPVEVPVLVKLVSQGRIIEESAKTSSKRAKTHTQKQKQKQTKGQSKVSRQSYPVKKTSKGAKINPLSVIEEDIDEAMEQEKESQHLSNPSIVYQLRSMLFPQSRKSTARGLKKRKRAKVTRRRGRRK
jgi:hypothetical protein